MKEVELYVHIPFCIKKCRYCDFLSFTSTREEQKRYVDALVQEILNKVWPTKWPISRNLDTMDVFKEQESDRFLVSSIFIGGGTPSVLMIEELERIMMAIRATFVLKKEVEITLECNPGTVDYDKLQGLLAVGINRISFGLQSCKNKELEKLGRIHDYETFLKNYKMARKVGFSNINIDLMSALPDQSLADYEESLQQVVKLRPEHISAYSLIIEEGTPYYERYEADEERRAAGLTPHELPSEETERSMYELTKALLHEAGYERYEISNYALEGKECNHNVGYWNRVNYLGYGLGSSSLLDEVRYKNVSILGVYNDFWLNGDADGEQQLNLRDIPGQVNNGICRNTSYLVPDKIMSIEQLTMNAQMEEFFFLGLRLISGIYETKFMEQFNQTVDQVYGIQLKQLEKQGLIVREKGKIRLSDYGIDISNYVLSEFIL